MPLDHVVDGQRADRAGDHRLHLDARAVGRARLDDERHGAVLRVDGDLRVDVRERELVAQRDQLAVRLAAWMAAIRATATTSPLGLVARRDPRGRGAGSCARRRAPAPSASVCGLAADIDHPRPTRRVQMRKRALHPGQS